MHRVNVTFEDKDWKALERYCKKLRPYQPVGTTVKEILLHGVLSCAGTEHDVLARNTTTQDDTCPIPASPSHLKNPDPEEEKKREDKIQKGKEVESEGATRLAPLDVSERIVSDLNSQTGSTARAGGKTIRGMIQARLNDGWTEADFFEVHRKKAMEWKGDKEMGRYLVFGTLYKPSNFEKYLGQPEVGPRNPQTYGKKNHVQRMTEAQDQGEWSWEGVE